MIQVEKKIISDEDLTYSFLSLLSTNQKKKVIESQKQSYNDFKAISHSQIKIVLIGEGAVGKTTLRLKFMGEDSTHGLYISTLGADFSLKFVDIENDSVMVQIWDIAGQSRFKEIVSGYFANSNGAMVVYDLTRMESFEQTKYWLDHLFSITGPIPFCIIGNKLDIAPIHNPIFDDLVSEADNTVKKLNDYVKEEYGFEVHHFLTSAKSGENVDNAFHLLTSDILKLLKKNSTSLDR